MVQARGDGGVGPNARGSPILNIGWRWGQQDLLLEWIWEVRTRRRQGRLHVFFLGNSKDGVADIKWERCGRGGLGRKMDAF